MNTENEKNTTNTNESPSEASFGGARYKRNYDRYKESSGKNDTAKGLSRKAKIGTVIAVTAFAALLIGLTFFVVAMIDRSKETDAAATDAAGTETALPDIDVKAFTVKLDVTGTEGVRHGYGLILTADGYIMADSALTADAVTINAVFENGATVSAYAAGLDEDNGVIFLKADAEGLTAAEIGDVSKLKTGESLYLIGAESGNSFKLIELGDAITDYSGYSIDRAKLSTFVNLSGCLAVNASGEVVAFPVEDADGWRLVFMTEVLPAIKDMINSGKAILDSDEEVTLIERLGIEIKSITADISEEYNIPSGCFVVSVTAIGSKIRKGDIIVSVDGVPVTDGDSLLRSLSDSGKLSIYRLNGYIETDY